MLSCISIFNVVFSYKKKNLLEQAKFDSKKWLKRNGMKRNEMERDEVENILLRRYLVCTGKENELIGKKKLFRMKKMR